MPRHRSYDGQLGWKERHRLLRENLREAWEASRHVPEDPGLRERYAEIPRLPIRLIVCPLELDVNQGGLLRLAEAFRLERVDIAPTDGHDFSGHRGSLGWQPHRWIPAEEAVAEAKAEGYTVAALDLDAEAHPVQRAPWRYPLAIVLGREREGIPPEVKAQCDFSVAIPLYGLVTSLNVGVAAGVAVNAAVSALPGAEPVRQTSRRLLGLPSLETPEEEDC